MIDPSTSTFSKAAHVLLCTREIFLCTEVKYLYIASVSLTAALCAPSRTEKWTKQEQRAMQNVKESSVYIDLMKQGQIVNYTG